MSGCVMYCEALPHNHNTSNVTSAFLMKRGVFQLPQTSCISTWE